MDQQAWVLEWGIWGLAAVAFIGATLVPISSEAAVAAALQVGMPRWHVLLSASVGNALGASTNYGLGALFADRARSRLAQSRSGARALAWIERYGAWSLLGSWLPVVGDPICLAAGLFRLPLWAFALFGLGTRVARYWVLIVLWPGA